MALSDDDGQALIWAGILMGALVLFGLVAMAIGTWWSDHMKDQRGADSAAVSAAVYYAMTQTKGESLPAQNPCTGQAGALSCATYVANLNNAAPDPSNPPAFVSLSYPGIVTGIQVTVKDTSVASFLGVQPTIGATATAGVFIPNAAANVEPIAADSNTASCWTQGQTVTLYFDKTTGIGSNCPTDGGFALIDLPTCNNGDQQTVNCILDGCGPNCVVNVGTATHDPGNKWHAKMCSAWSSLLGQTIVLPVFTDNGTTFQITGFVSFLVSSSPLSYSCGSPPYKYPNAGFIQGTYEGNVIPPVTGGPSSGGQNFGTYAIAMVQ